MFYKVNDKNEIIETCIENYDGKFIETDKSIVSGFDGGLYFEEDVLTENYIQAELEYNNRLNCSNEINDLKRWFDVDYARKEQKYRRLIALGDSSVEPLLLELYKEAEIKRARIQELEVIVSNVK